MTEYKLRSNETLERLIKERDQQNFAKLFVCEMKKEIDRDSVEEKNNTLEEKPIEKIGEKNGKRNRKKDRME